MIFFNKTVFTFGNVIITLTNTICIDKVIIHTSQYNVLRYSRVITSYNIIKALTMYLTKELNRHKK